MFTDELQIIVDGTVVQDKYFNNTAYTTWQSSYPLFVFSAISYANQNLQFVSSTALTEFWNNLTTTYNLTNDELTFIQNHRKEFIDNLTVNIVYSGIPGLNLTVTDPQNNNTINLNFPGNVIQRTSQIVYTGSPYEGVKSFAIATTKVTNTVLQYWLEQYPNYQNNSVMNSTYNTFLTALMVEYVHDQFADNISTRYNVTWSRTSPIIVSVSEDVSQTYMTLECDHSMGMTVVGTQENMWNFNYNISSSISYIEYLIMSGACSTSNNPYQWCSANGNFDSVMVNLLKDYLFDNTSLKVFAQNGYIIEQSIFNGNNFIVLDVETGLMRDIDNINNFCGAYSDALRYTIISGGFYRHDNPVGEFVTYTISFFWDGEGQVLITNSHDSIVADDELIIVGPSGTITRYYGRIENVGPPIDITGILEPGANVIQVIVQDLYTCMIGCSALRLVQVDTVLNYDQQTHFDPYQFANHIIYFLPFIPEGMKQGKKWNAQYTFLGGEMIMAGYFLMFIPGTQEIGSELMIHGAWTIIEYWDEPVWYQPVYS